MIREVTRVFAVVALLLALVSVACKAGETAKPTVAPQSAGISYPKQSGDSQLEAKADDASSLAPKEPNAIIIGLDADMSSGSAESGEAIRRGIVLAMDEINEAGGLLGRPLRLVVRDHRGNPARGVDNIEEFAGMDNVVAVVGGIHTPVALEELESIHHNQIIYLDPWAAGTPVIENGYSPNYAFRVSVRDEYAGEFLINEAIGMGYQRPGLLLEQTGWGRSNERAIMSALSKRGLASAGIQWFNWGSMI